MTQRERRPNARHGITGQRIKLCALAACAIFIALDLAACSGSGEKDVHANEPAVTVGVTRVARKSLGREITLSSELVPFQEIDVYAKESGYVKKLYVDY